jgi:hypothetical protein
MVQMKVILLMGFAAVIGLISSNVSSMLGFLWLKNYRLSALKAQRANTF